MSKNMTRKGLAFGAGISLISATVAGLPASAAITVAGDGETPVITLAPTSGPATAFAISAADEKSFSLTATPATAVMAGGSVKFKVSDPDAKFVPGGGSTAGHTVTTVNGVASSADGRVAVLDNALNNVVINVASSVADGAYLVTSTSGSLDVDDADAADVTTILSENTVSVGYVYEEQLFLDSENAFDASIDELDGGETLQLAAGAGVTATSTTNTVAADQGGTMSGQEVTLVAGGSELAAGTYLVSSDVDIRLHDSSDTNAFTVMSAGETFILTSDGTNYTFQTDTAESGTAANLISEITLTVQELDSARASDNSFIVDSKVTAAGNSAAVEILTTDAVTRSSSVQAWVDAFADDIIGGTEYASAAQTIQFVELDDIGATTVLNPPKVGDESLTAKVTTSPLINIAEDGDSDLIEVVFTRQDSTTTAVSDGASQETSSSSSELGVITATIPLLVAADQFDTIGTLTAGVGTVTTNDSGEWEKVSGTIMDIPTDSQAVDEANSSITDEVVTVATVSDHNLRVGDRIDLDGVTGDNATALNLDATRHEITSVPSTKTLTFALADATDISSFGGTVTLDTETYTSGTGDALVDRVFAGDYTAQAFLAQNSATSYKQLGAKAARGTASPVAADVIFSSVASATVQGKSLKTDDGSEKILVKAGEESVDVTLTVVDKDGDAVSAGRAVVTTLSSRTAAVKVNAKTAGESLLTDANGQVTLTISSSTAIDGDAVTIKAVAEGVTTADSQIVVEWDKQAYSLYDLATTQGALSTDNRYIEKGTGYTMNLMLADQWYQPAPSDTYRVKVSGSGVSEGFVTLTDGKADVAVTDNLGTDFDHVLTVQKATAGVFADTSTAVTITNKLIEAADAKVTLAADGSSLYASATADLSDAVSSKALVERDNRQAFVVQPSYTADSGGALVVSGKVTKSSSGASLTDAVVTLSGPNNILFSNGDVDSRGGLTVVADNSGEFSVTLYSTSAQTDSVITVTSVGVEATTKVSFTGQGVGEGTVLTIDTPANVQPAGTFQVKAKLADAFGNGVDTTAGRMKVTYTGAGIYFGTLPTETDANGDLTFSVLLGANDTGSITVTVQYDQNGDADFVDAKDLTTTKTISIGGSSTQKVNAGSFKGFVAVYARGYEGQRLSAKIGNDWVIVDPIVNNESDDLHRTTDFTGAGVDIAVRIYIDRVLIDTINLTTK